MLCFCRKRCFVFVALDFLALECWILTFLESDAASNSFLLDVHFLFWGGYLLVLWQVLQFFIFFRKWEFFSNKQIFFFTIPYISCI